MDWPFAFERSEMLREFQTELLVSIGHELRSPLSSQMSALQMIVTDLCDSPEEERSYAEAAIEGVKRSLLLLETFSDLARQWIPVQPLDGKAIALAPILQKVYSLTYLQAQDRGVRYQWPDATDPDLDSVRVRADEAGLTQALLGICGWGLRCLRYGRFELTIQDSPGSSLDLKMVLTGGVVYPVEPEGSLAWRVGARLLQEMQGSVTLQESTAQSLTMDVTLVSVR